MRGGRATPLTAYWAGCGKMDRMTDDTRTSDQQDDDSVIVVGPDGRPLGTVGTDGNLKPEEPGNLIEQPAKVMRIGSMIKQLLEEGRAAPLDEASRGRLREIHQRSIKELEDGLAPELQEELERLSLPFEGATVSVPWPSTRTVSVPPLPSTRVIAPPLGTVAVADWAPPPFEVSGPAVG